MTSIFAGYKPHPELYTTVLAVAEYDESGDMIRQELRQLRTRRNMRSTRRLIVKPVARYAWTYDAGNGLVGIGEEDFRERRLTFASTSAAIAYMRRAHRGARLTLAD